MQQGLESVIDKTGFRIWNFKIPNLDPGLEKGSDPNH